jgi:DNA-binding NarL/FixJ family response regulator
VRRVIICDEQMLIRTGLRTILGLDPAIYVAGEASGSHHAVDLVASLRPDAVVAGSLAPATQIALALRSLDPAPQVRSPGVLALVSPEDETRPPQLLAAVRAGVRGLVGRNDSPAGLCRAVAAVCDGHGSLTPRVSRWLLDWAAASVPDPRQRPAGARALSDAELKVLLFLAEGMLSTEIAGTLGISDATVRSHVHHLLTKLGLRNRAQAVAFAYRAGLVRPPPPSPHPADILAPL